MTTLTQLYNNIKTFVLQNFEHKTQEDINLPNQVENLFVYNNGKNYVKETTIPTPVTGDGSSQIYQSDLYDNLVDLISQNFFKRNEKTNQYKGWLISEYVNGNWYIGESAPSQIIVNQGLINDSVEMYYAIVNSSQQIYAFRMYEAIVENIVEGQVINVEVSGINEDTFVISTGSYIEDGVYYQSITVNENVKRQFSITGLPVFTVLRYGNIIESGVVIKVVVNPYFDEVANVYYTGYDFSITFNVNTSIAQSNGEYVTSPSTNTTTIYID